MSEKTPSERLSGLLINGRLVSPNWGTTPPPGERQMDYPEYVAMLERRIERLERKVYQLRDNESLGWPTEEESRARSAIEAKQSAPAE